MTILQTITFEKDDITLEYILNILSSNDSSVEELRRDHMKELINDGILTEVIYEYPAENKVEVKRTWNHDSDYNQYISDKSSWENLQSILEEDGIIIVDSAESV